MNETIEILTDKMRSVLESSVSLAIHSKNSEVGVLHMLWALVADSGSVLNQIFNKFSIEKTAVELEIKSEISNLPTSSNVTKENVRISRELMNSLELAKGLMTSSGDKFIAVDTWLIANLNADPLKKILSKFADFSEIKKELEALRGGKSIDSQTADETLEALSKFGVDLTAKAIAGELDPVIGRDEVISRMMQILIRKTKNNPILLGEPGVGKTAVVEGLAQLIAKKRFRSACKTNASSRLI